MYIIVFTVECSAVTINRKAFSKVMPEQEAAFCCGSRGKLDLFVSMFCLGAGWLGGIRGPREIQAGSLRLILAIWEENNKKKT